MLRRLLPLLVALAAALVGCGGDGGGDRPAPQRSAADRPVATLGSDSSPERRLLAQLYAQALAAEGFAVDLKANLGTARAALEALRTAEIDVYPAPAGALRGVDPGADGLATLAPTPFSTVDGLAVTDAFAREHELEEIGDLAGIDGLRLGAPPELLDRLPALERAYDLGKVRFAPLTTGLQYPALDDGKIDVALVRTTDGQLGEGDYRVLADARRLFGSGHVVPVVAARVLRAEGPEFALAIDAVSAELTTEAMQRMNAAIELDGEAPEDVAREFLAAHDLG